MVSGGGGVEESKSSQQQPWLMINDRQNCCIQSNIFNNKAPLLYDVGGEISEFLGRHIACSFGEWVLLTGTDTGDNSLVNLLSNERIELPSLYFNYDFCVLTSHPYDPTCHIVYFHEEENAFVFCQPGDKEFTIRKWDYEFPPNPGPAVVAGNIFFSLDGPEHYYSLAMIEFKESIYRFELLQMDGDKEVWSRGYALQFNFFEYSGELFKVYKILCGGFASIVTGFEILKADLVKKKWVSVKKLGRVAIFIGDTNLVQCVPVESGITANSIYFLEEDDPYNYYIYSLEEGTIRMKPTFFSSMEKETTEDTRLYWIMMHCDASFPKLLKGDQESICQNSEKETKAIEEVEEVVGVQNSWNMVLPELLNLIQLYLFGRDHAVFRLVCKPWQHVSIRDYSIPSLLSLTTLLELCQSFSPLLMFQEDITISDDSVPIFRFFDPVHRKSYRTGIPELRGTEIHYSRDGWLLVSRHSDESIFFFNPLTQEKIELPRNPYYAPVRYRDSFSFSSLPTCSNCLVVGMHCNGSFMCTLKHGEQRWKRYRLDDQPEDIRCYCYCPVVLNGLHHFMCDDRDVVVFNLKDGVRGQSPYCHSWSTKFKRPDDLREEDFFLEMDGALAFVSVKPDGGEISIFKWNDLETDWELMEGGVGFGGKEMFLSKRGSFLEKIDDDVGGMGNNIFLPMIDHDAKEGVFYSLATNKYHTFYSGYSSELPYNVDKFLNGIWVKPDLKIVGDNNLKWFM